MVTVHSFGLAACFFLVAMDTCRAAYLPEVSMTSPQLIAYWGYPVETHQCVTEDGYMLTLHRIPHGRNNGRNETKPPVYLQHPLMSSSAEWLVNLPNQSLAFILADKVRKNCFSFTIFSKYFPEAFFNCIQRNNE